MPASLGRLTRLKRLWLDRNQLTRLPDQLGDCTSLQELYLDHNPHLRALPASLARLTDLRRLYLQGCDPAGVEVPDEVAALPALAGGGGYGSGGAEAFKSDVQRQVKDKLVY